MKYRFTYRGKPAGPWRARRAEAADDAVRAGKATRSEHNPDRLWWNVWAGIEEDAGDP